MAVNEAGAAFLGAGWKFPIQVDPWGRIARATGEVRVEESVAMILGTALGERVMRPQFGCQVHDLVFGTNNPPTLGAAVQSVRRALVAAEPRIDVLDVDATTTPEEPNVVLVRVSYRIRANNVVGNLVYPFMVEGS